MSYFEHPSISNSDLKRFKMSLNGGIQVEESRLQEIFELGTMIHTTILEPNKLTQEDKEKVGYPLAQRMHKTFFAEPLCRMFINSSDFYREKEFYRQIEVGGMQYNARCKCDGYRTGMKAYLEIKGLAVSTEKSFMEAIDRLDYDQAAVHYMLTSQTNMCLMVGISKKNPDLLFKKVIKMHDETYAIGEEKLITTLKQLHEFSPEDVKLVA